MDYKVVLMKDAENGESIIVYGTIRCVSWENRSCRLVRLFSIG